MMIGSYDSNKATFQTSPLVRVGLYNFIKCDQRSRQHDQDMFYIRSVNIIHVRF